LTKRKKKTVARGVARGLGKLAKGAAVGVVTELASILTLGIYKPPKR
jgi:hypothetical protein